MLKSLDLCLSDAVQAELLNYINVFRRAKQIKLPVLVFPVNTGRIICKTIRYFAAIYSLATFYVSSRGSRMLVVCHKDYLIYHYFTFYEDIFLLTNEDTEVIDYLDLHNSFIRSSRSLQSWRLRQHLGLPSVEHLNIERDWRTENRFLALNSEEQQFSQDRRKEDENILDYATLNCFSQETHKESGTLNKISKVANSGSRNERSFKIVHNSVTTLSDSDMDKYLRGPSLIVKANQNYWPFQYITKTNLDNVVEVYDIPISFITKDLLEIFGDVLFRVKWCDDSHALIITKSAKDAKKVMAIKHELCKTRSLLHGSPVATVIASMLDFPVIVEAMLNE